MEAGIAIQASMSTRLKCLVILASSPQLLDKYRNKELSVRLFSLGVILVSSHSTLSASERCDSRINGFDFICEACIRRCAHLLGDFPRYRTILCASRHTEIPNPVYHAHRIGEPSGIDMNFVLFYYSSLSIRSYSNPQSTFSCPSCRDLYGFHLSTSLPLSGWWLVALFVHICFTLFSTPGPYNTLELALHKISSRRQ